MKLNVSLNVDNLKYFLARAPASASIRLWLEIAPELWVLPADLAVMICRAESTVVRELRYLERIGVVHVANKGQAYCLTQRAQNRL